MEIARNELVYLETENNMYFAIHRCSDGEMVGMVNFYDESLYFQVAPQYQKMHYCSNAVYLLTKYIHEVLHYEEICAFIPGHDEQSMHIVEHAGYYVAQATPGNLVYIHDGQRAEIDTDTSTKSTMYFAGGCFWGVEKAFKCLRGVRKTVTGYVNGNRENVSYEDVLHGTTGFKECVKVSYDPEVVDLKTLLMVYFMIINPEQDDGQGNDIGEQYRTGVYYPDPELKEELEAIFEIHRQKHPVFYTELRSLKNFYKAENYHQGYLDNNPNGYCHISPGVFEEIKKI